jgi:2,4-dienoyl-CoA reductase-like NADH-dependent reductase (Old Yellow Enzyme family)
MTSLFDPIVIRDVVIRNRLWVAPMCQYTILEWDGIPREWHLVHLGAMAAGGAGLIIAEASAVSPEGRISPADTGIWNTDQLEGWKRVVDFAHTQGATMGIQLAHAGRKASTFPDWGHDGRQGTMAKEEGGWPTVGPSGLTYPGLAAPTALDIPGIHKIVDEFVAAAERAVRAGFDVIEIHAGHGYLIHQFLSPISNDRTDVYGGSLENRARLLLQIVAGIRGAIGEGAPLIVRLSATDYIDNGWDEIQAATVAGWAAEVGADVFDVSSGGIVSGVPIPVAPGYQVPFAAFVKESAHVITASVGLITTSTQAAEIVESGKADAVLMAREISRDPHFPLRAAHELGVDIGYWPPQYLRTHWPKVGQVESAFNDG